MAMLDTTGIFHPTPEGPITTGTIVPSVEIDTVVVPVTVEYFAYVVSINTSVTVLP